MPTAKPSGVPDGPLMRSPAFRLHAELGAVFEREASWEIPATYGDPDKECVLLREQIVVAAVTARSKMDLRGRIGDPRRLAKDGELVASISELWAMLLAKPMPVSERVDELGSALGGGAMVTDVTHLYAGYALAGPLVWEALARLSGWDPRTLPVGWATGAPMAEVRAIVLRRDLQVPLFEVYVATEFGRFVWQTILDVVHRLGGGPAGWSGLRAEGWS